jgi:hypothetical protein
LQVQSGESNTLHPLLIRSNGDYLHGNIDFPRRIFPVASPHSVPNVSIRWPPFAWQHRVPKAHISHCLAWQHTQSIQKHWKSNHHNGHQLGVQFTRKNRSYPTAMLWARPSRSRPTSKIKWHSAVHGERYSLNNQEPSSSQQFLLNQIPPAKKLLNQRMSRHPHAVPPSTSTIMAARWHPTSLMALPVEVQIEIAGHIAVTSEWPMDDLAAYGRHACPYTASVVTPPSAGAWQWIGADTGQGHQVTTSTTSPPC